MRDDGGSRVQIHAPLRFVGQRPQTGDLLAVIVQLRGVLQAQHDRMLPHARFSGFNVRAQDVPRC